MTQIRERERSHADRPKRSVSSPRARQRHPSSGISITGFDPPASSCDPVRPLFHIYVSCRSLTARHVDSRKTARRLSIICPLQLRDRERTTRDVPRRPVMSSPPADAPLIFDSISSHSRATLATREVGLGRAHPVTRLTPG